MHDCPALSITFHQIGGSGLLLPIVVDLSIVYYLIPLQKSFLGWMYESFLVSWYEDILSAFLFLSSFRQTHFDSFQRNKKMNLKRNVGGKGYSSNNDFFLRYFQSYQDRYKVCVKKMNENIKIQLIKEVDYEEAIRNIASLRSYFNSSIFLHHVQQFQQEEKQFVSLF